MRILFNKAKTIKKNCDIVIITNKVNNIQTLREFGFSEAEVNYIKESALKREEKKIVVNQYHRQVFIVVIGESPVNKTLETLRRDGNSIQGQINDRRKSEVLIFDDCGKGEFIEAFAEGMALGTYQFLKYKSEDLSKKKNTLNEILVHSSHLTQKRLDRLMITTEATFIARDLVNEPAMYLTAPQLAKEVQKLAKDAGFTADVLNKTKIEALKMGGLLAVNKGSIDPPTFTILEWNPLKLSNKKPIVLVGKGVVYDTGGMNLKPGSSMDTMKCDMSGAAAVAATMWALAKANVPIHCIGLIPATDNRPDGNAQVPGDVITMSNGLTVEVISTDAEGRLILGDALTYASRFNPDLVIDLATLTGAASRAIGKYGIVAMGNDDRWMELLKNSGDITDEKLAVFPFWDDYDDLIKSDVADIKNIGGAEAGMITAGKFLARFVSYPWIHLDIAGPAFMDSKFNYRGIGGTGIGVRLLFDFMDKHNYKAK